MFVGLFSFIWFCLKDSTNSIKICSFPYWLILSPSLNHLSSPIYSFNELATEPVPFYYLTLLFIQNQIQSRVNESENNSIAPLPEPLLESKEKRISRLKSCRTELRPEPMDSFSFSSYFFLNETVTSFYSYLIDASVYVLGHWRGNSIGRKETSLLSFTVEPLSLRNLSH